jgi:nicotinamidase-related amidase
MEALVIVDVVYEFITGKYGGQYALDLIPNINSAIRYFRDEDKTIVFVCDKHKEWDQEVRLFGEHSMSNDKMSEIHGEISYREDDIIIPKSTFSAFYKTRLDSFLRSRSINTVFLAGLTTETCVRHTAAGAFYRGYDIAIVSNAVDSPNRKQHRIALEYMSSFYCAEIINL